MGWIKVNRVWEAGGERLCHKVSREKIGLGSSEDQESKGRCDISINTNGAVMQSHILQCDTSVLTSVPITLGDFGHKAQHICPPPWTVPSAVSLAEDFAASQPEGALLPVIRVFLLPTLPSCCPSYHTWLCFFAALQIQGLMSIAVRKEKYRRESWPCESIVAAAKLRRR